MKNIIECKGKCLIQNKMTLELYLVDNVNIALREAIRMNRNDRSSPSFYLYDSETQFKCNLVAELCREIGSDNLYWKSIVK